MQKEITRLSSTREYIPFHKAKAHKKREEQRLNKRYDDFVRDYSLLTKPNAVVGHPVKRAFINILKLRSSADAVDPVDLKMTCYGHPRF